jgi:hypothetical protein
VKHLFRFDATGGRKPPRPLGIQFTKEPSGDPVTALMLAEGMLSLPDHLQRLPRHELADLGFPFVRWSRKYGRRYLPVQTHKRYDS